ncbi:UNVERIFIED_CONTAM: hypothetical protein K2H54_061196 [Gekko kuhli]
MGKTVLKLLSGVYSEILKMAAEMEETGEWQNTPIVQLTYEQLKKLLCEEIKQAVSTAFKNLWEKPLNPCLNGKDEGELVQSQQGIDKHLPQDKVTLQTTGL